MTATLGNWTLTLAVLAGAAAVLTGIASIRFDSAPMLSRARRLVGVFVALLTVASAALLHALVNSDFSIAYVAGYTDRALPTGYKLAAFWAGQEGSILLWAWLLAVMAAVVAWRQRGQAGVEPAVTLTTLAVVCTFFAALMTFAANPFTLRPTPALDGHGLNPLLQHPSMIAHPPLLFVGYAGFTVPFAMLLGALAAKRRDNAWIMDTRRWLVFSWLFLSVGILLGAEWAYVELGWGGYWAWDPVENASLLPWLTATALLHSIAIHRYRGMFKRWNASLIACTFLLCIFGTYLTRSGVIQSVHAFGESLVGTFFLGFLVLCTGVSIGVLAWYWRALAPERPLEGLTTKEGAFLAVNVLLVLMTLTVLVGTTLPLLTGVFVAEPVSVGPPFYNAVVAPMAMLLLALMAIGPLLRPGQAGAAELRRRLPVPGALAGVAVVAALVLGLRDLWALAATAIVAAALGSIVLDLGRALRQRLADGSETAASALVRLVDDNHRRYGGQLVHLGVLMMMVGIIGSSLFGVEKAVKLGPGETTSLGDYTLAFHELSEKRGANYTAVQAHVEVIDAAGRISTLHPQMRFYDKSEQPHAEVALQSTLGRDIYVTLAGWEDGGRVTALQAIINPLVSWIWIGGLTLTVGGLLCLFPRLLPQTQTTGAAQPATRSAKPARPASLRPTPAEVSP